MTDFELLDRMIIPPAHSDRLQTSNLQRVLKEQEDLYANTLEELEKQEKLAQEKRDAQNSEEPSKDSSKTPEPRQLTPLEQAIIDKLTP